MFRRRKKEILYRVVCSESMYKLADEVKMWLSEGWELQGGISIARAEDSSSQTVQRYCIHYAQAMTKK